MGSTEIAQIFEGRGESTLDTHLLLSGCRGTLPGLSDGCPKLMHNGGNDCMFRRSYVFGRLSISESGRNDFEWIARLFWPMDLLDIDYTELAGRSEQRIELNHCPILLHKTR